ncbi:hypothetical protein F5X96DRAFT_622895 [Biscogniauxia mediterranea]|nr:hypothetical protein F5X96DRAFT_622895 [Biscogniauxia mediterranea]
MYNLLSIYLHLHLHLHLRHLLFLIFLLLLLLLLLLSPSSLSAPPLVSLHVSPLLGYPTYLSNTTLRNPFNLTHHIL